MDIMTFGVKENRIEYRKRPAVYGLIFTEHKEKIAIIQTSDGKCFLPGGGVEGEETHEECMKREALEEMGRTIEMGPFIGKAQRYFYSDLENVHYLNEASFYICEAGPQICEPAEEDHSLVWLDPASSADYLYHDHQAWAVDEALKRFRHKLGTV